MRWRGGRGAGALLRMASFSAALGCGSAADSGTAEVVAFEPPPASGGGAASGAPGEPSTDQSGAEAAVGAPVTGAPAVEAPGGAVPLDPAAPAPEAPTAAVPSSLPGVVVVEPSGPSCAPLCQLVLEAASEPDGDDWAIENDASCVIPDTLTAISNQPCTTGSPLPSPEPLPGVLVGDGIGSACRPLCVAVTAPSSPDAPDWAFERNASCVLPGSATANAAARSCTFGAPEVELVPPPLTGPKVAPGFFVQNGRLLDAYGEDFVIRGVNNPHIWFDSAAQYQAYSALDSIAAYGTNTIRVVWETNGSVALLREILHRIVGLGMVPMVELHDATGSNSRVELLDMAEYYASPDVRDVLSDFREYLLVNIANEWSGNDYFGAYQEAITLLRNNGVTHTLVIDANGSGQNGQVIVDNAAALTNADPQRNLLFSVHMYQSYGTTAAVDNFLDTVSARGIPIIVGEFGWQHDGQNVAWERILSRANDLGVGYVAWSWFGNDTNTAHLDMALGPNGPLTEWGNDVMVAASGSIQSTAEPASIFD